MKKRAMRVMQWMQEQKHPTYQSDADEVRCSACQNKLCVAINGDLHGAVFLCRRCLKILPEQRPKP